MRRRLSPRRGGRSGTENTMNRRCRSSLVGLARLRRLVGFLVVASAMVGHPAMAQVGGLPPEMEHVGVREHLDGQLPLNRRFVDQDGKSVTLADVIDGKRPVVLQFAYHTCPVTCSMVTRNIATALKSIPWTLGKEYVALTISIDPDESAEKMANKRASILSEYGRASDGWTFLRGDQASIAAVAAAAGFEFQYDDRQKQWAHPSLAMVVKPDGKMARYLYGFDFAPSEVRLALLEASEGRSISTLEQIILYCYHYDPQGGKYVLVAQRIMQIGGGVVASVLACVLAALWARELRKARNPASLAKTASASSLNPGAPVLPGSHA